MPLVRLKNKLAKIRVEKPSTLKRFWMACVLCSTAGILLLKKRDAIIREAVTSNQVYEEQSAVVQKKISAVQEDIKDLKLVAMSEGTVLAHRLEKLQGTYVKRGREIMSIVSEDRKKILASIDQETIAAFRGQMDRYVEVIVPSMNRSSFFARVVRVSPKAETIVPDKGLSAAYGGPLAVHQGMSSGQSGMGGGTDFEFFSPRFSVEVEVPKQEAENLLVGQLVTIRLQGQSVSLWGVAKKWLHDYFSRRLNGADPI